MKKNETHFAAEYKKLNPAQREAVDSIEGPVMVVAGPGTGKTQGLSMRVGNILKRTDTAPESILALSFTEAGAHNLRKRLVALIGQAGYRVRISTFHGFCNEVIQRFSAYFPRIIGDTNANIIDKIDILEYVIAKNKLAKLKPFANPYHYVRDIENRISKLKRENIDPHRFEKLARQESEKNHERNAEFLLVYRAYEDELCKRKLYDYDDMIMEVLRECRSNPELLASLQEEIQYILADEHQDANAGQNELLTLLMSYHQNPNIFVVGDEMQAIFRFQGASLENFAGFRRTYPSARVIVLKENYRSVPSIVNAALTLALGKELVATRTKTPGVKGSQTNGVRVVIFDTSEAELYFLRKDIEGLIASGVDPGEIAVLYRDNKDVLPVVRVFEKGDVPFLIESDQDILEDTDIRKLIFILRAVEHIEDVTLFAEAMHVDFLNVPSQDVYRFLREKKRSPGIQSLVSDFSRWHKLSRNKGLVELFEIITRESGFLSHVVSLSDSVIKLEKLSALFEELKTLTENHRHYALSDFIRYLDLLETHNVLLKRDTRPGLIIGVHLSTAHRSKGQEYDYVYIIGAVDGHWGGRRIYDKLSFSFLDGQAKLAGDKDEEEEKRLFYVALTRAREQVTVTYSRKRSDGRENLPSRFIDEMGELGGKAAKLDTGEREKASLEDPIARYQERKNFGPKASDKEYIKELFDNQSLSVTALNNYLRCPWQYFYVNLLRIPTAIMSHQLYGTAVHASLHELFEGLKNGKCTDKKSFLKMFELALKREPLSEHEFELALKRGKQALGGYFDTYKNTWKSNVLTEFGIKGVEVGGVKLSGRLDKIEFLDLSTSSRRVVSGAVNVVDYKTGKPKSRNDIEGNTKSSDGNIKRQLVFYKLLLNRYADRRYKMQSGEIDFVEPNERGYYKKYKFEISNVEVSKLEDTIKRVGKEIRSLSFFDKRCGDSKCEWCKLRVMMRQQ